MSYEEYETSTDGGSPVEIYDLTFRDQVYRYTSNQVAVEVDGQEYEATPISRGRIAHAVEKRSEGRLEVVVPGDNAFVQSFVRAVAGSKALLTLRRYHRDDPVAEVILIYKGTIQTVRFEQNGRRALMHAISLTSAESRAIPRMTYQGLCNHMLYDARCKVNKTFWRRNLYVLSVSADGKILTVPGAPAFGAGFFANGYCTWDDDFRMVTEQDGMYLHILVPFAVAPIAQWIDFYAGCKHRLAEDCDTKFSNAANYGGFPYVPLKNPFESGLE